MTSMCTDIAIVGASFKMPQEAENENGYWDILEEKRNVMTEWPESRINLDSFYDATGASNKIHSRGAHFLKQDPALFDAPFFSIAAKEAESMDPQHRMMLEAAYRAFENAGMPVESLKGTRTGVFAASMSDDYNRMTVRDPESMIRPTIVGTAFSLLPNRVSWHFDLLGPSIHIDTACSGSMVALDMACQSLHSGDASMALVAGANLILGPEGTMMLSNGNYLSPDSVCYSFDHRANGYARGEGIVAIVIKPLSDAVRDGDMIRAVIRSTGSNQDGRTPTLTQPSTDSQEQLIRHVYQKAGLDLRLTRFFEAHGTGTRVGDPAEMKAIGRVFRPYRSAQEPLYVGSAKSNIGHLEGGAGLAGVIKAMLILERGIIPPNALFEKINPNIDASFYNVSVPTDRVVWPTKGLRRISVNSFGFGGSNAHVVMDDALHSLEDRGLEGNHQTVRFPSTFVEKVKNNNDVSINGGLFPAMLMKNGKYIDAEPTSTTCDEEWTGLDGDRLNGTSQALTKHLTQQDDKERGIVNGTDSNGLTEVKPNDNTASHFGSLSRLLIWSAADETTLKSMVQAYQRYCNDKVRRGQLNLDQLAFTLASRRSHMLWRTFAVLDPEAITRHATDNNTTLISMAKPTRASADANLAFVFTGQGAQYANMGIELTKYPVFQGTLERIDSAYRSFGCPWSLFDALSQGSTIDRPDYSQPLCTALQIALVELLKSFGVFPSAVVGHSSGEIAAAYATGALSLNSACKVAYYRGKLAEKLRQTVQTPGAMLSANLPVHKIREYLESVASPEVAKQIHVACINSPLNSTLSGPKAAVELVKVQLNKAGIFAQEINTGVAYHSPSMQAIASEYMDLLESLESSDYTNPSSVLMVSSVSGCAVVPQSSLASAQYWVDNLVSPVRFSDALATLAQEQLQIGISSISHVVEVGPHPALRRPIQDTLRGASKKQPTYSFVLHKSKPAIQATLEFLGQLFCGGYPLSVAAVNDQENNTRHLNFSTDCPEYPFNHSRTYWMEPRLSRDFRLRGNVPGDTLGSRFHDWNPLEPKWRNFLGVESVPWVKDHVIVDTILYPGAGLLIIALEAVKQICPDHRQVAGYHIKNASFLNPVIVSQKGDERTEVIVQLRRIQTPYEKESVWSDVKIMTQSKGHWAECFRSTIQIQYIEDGTTPVDGGLERRLRDESIMEILQQVTGTCGRKLDRQNFYESCHEAGIMYGESFMQLDDICWDGGNFAIGRVKLIPELQTASLTHPITLDCALQVTLAQATNGLSEPVRTFVPSYVSDMWVAASGWQPPQTSSVRAFSERMTSSSLQVEAKIHIVADDGSPLCVINKIVMAPVSGRQYDEKEEAKLLYRVEWKPQLSLMGKQELTRTCNTDLFLKDETMMANYRKVLEPALDKVIRKTIGELSAIDRQRVPGFLEKHVQWMEHHVAHAFNSQGGAGNIMNQSLEALLQELEHLYPSWGIFPVVARNLRPILLGEVDPLQIAFETGLAERFYADIFNNICDDRFHNLIDLLVHERPTLRMLEVGAGTGSMTSHILSTMSNIERRTGGNRFSVYTYTDISASFFEIARSRFQEFSDRMEFKAFDLNRGAAGQGFEEGTYDIIVASAVLHATVDLKATLRNLRTLLKPGGHLMCLEVVAPENVTTNFAFGVLPGWWSSDEDYRRLSPTITEQQWDQLLRNSDFSGNDLVLRDYESDDYHTFSIMLSTFSGSSAHKTLAPRRVLLLVRDQTQQEAIDVAKSIWGHLSHYEAKIVSLDQVQDIEFTEDDVLISLLEVSSPFLYTMSGKEYQILKCFIQRVRNLLWITAASQSNHHYAEYDVMQGFMRSIRSENIDKRIITLGIDIDTQESGSLLWTEFVTRVFASAFVAGSEELEYRVHDNQLITARLVEEKSLNTRLRSLISPQLKVEPWRPGPPVRLSVGMPGFLDTLEFVTDEAYQDNLAHNEIEVESKAWGLSFRDVFVALGRLPGDDLGYDCSGVVTQIGSSCGTSFQVGDRVFGGAFGCMRTYLRAPMTHFIKIPNMLSFEEAASLLAPGLTAYYSFISVARLKEKEKVLIHSAAGATGQMAIWIAQMIGAEIFATVGFDEKKQFLVDKFNIPEDHVFYSRDISFAHGIMRMTKGYGVDVVLNSLSGDGLRASWECIAPYGRFIEIGKADIEANSTLPMAQFARNVSFTAVDLHDLSLSRPEVLEELRQNLLRLLVNGVIQHPKPLSVYSTENIEQAFRYLQSGKNTGRIVVSVQDSDLVPKRMIEKCNWQFDPGSSYVIAGASGGLGRAISKWMANKGAKHLILLSRSGSDSLKAAEVVAELRQRGINVKVPKCDVSSKAALSAVLRECATMPPIKGCINSAMALHDTVFEKMTHRQWETSIQSKVQASLNLHELLPQSLDFFVLLSSLSGIYGSITQSNYSAGCTFQDALARQRVALGQKAVSLDLGWIRNIGIVAETTTYQQTRQSAADMMPVEETELMALLDIYCDPDCQISSAVQSQLLVGAVTPVDCLSRGLEPPTLALRPMFSGFSLVMGKQIGAETEDGLVNFATRFKLSENFEERAELVAQWLATKLARSMSIAPDDVELYKQLSDYGVDSLMAVELRNWIAKDFEANVAVFEIMGGTTIAAIGNLVAGKISAQDKEATTQDYTRS